MFCFDLRLGLMLKLRLSQNSSTCPHGLEITEKFLPKSLLCWLVCKLILNINDIQLFLISLLKFHYSFVIWHVQTVSGDRAFNCKGS